MGGEGRRVWGGKEGMGRDGGRKKKNGGFLISFVRTLLKKKNN